MLTTLRAALALALLAGLYVLASVLVLIDLTLLFGPLLTEPSQVQSYTTFVNLARLTAPPVLAVLVGLFAVSRRTGGPRPSVLLDEEDAPALWAMVTGLAAAVGTAAPTEVRVTAGANAQVSEEAQLLGLAAGTRRLYVGLPLILGLSTDELRAVLCHELGHYARRHTWIGAVTYRGAVALEQIQELLGSMPGRRRRFDAVGGLLRRIFGSYARLYLRLSFAIRRRQELEADRAAVAVAGQAATAAALRSAHAIGVAWADFLGRFAGTARAEGFIPGGMFDAFADMLADPLSGDVLDRLRATPPDVAKSPLDSHPSLAARLRRIEASRAAAVRRDLTPAAGLAGDPGKLFPAVAELVFPAGSGAPVLAWPEWADLVADALAVADARRLVDAARRVAAEPAPTLGTVLQLLIDGRAGQLAAALRPAGGGPGPGPGQARQALRELRAVLAALVGCALVQAGYASWKLNWTGPSTLVGLDIAVVEFPSLVDAAVRSPAQVVNLLQSLAYLDIAVDEPAELDRITVPGAGPADARARAQPAGAAGAARVTWPWTPATPPETRREWLLMFNVGFMIFTLIVGAVTLDHQLHPATIAFPLPGRSDLYPSAPDPYSALLPTSPAQFGLPTGLAPSVLRSLEPVPTLLLWGTIVVAPGDTLAQLACQYGTSVHLLQQVNHLGRSTRLLAGQKLLVPDLVVRPGDCGAIP